VEEKNGFQWVDGNNVTVTIDTKGEGRRLILEVTADDPVDGKYLFKYYIFRVDNETGLEVEVAADTFEVEIGMGDSEACGVVFFVIPIVGLLALVAFVKRE